ncbi:Na(+)-translocating NADH-quinone reductase subunit C [Aliikangiella coralliicola]|uniref:Na(+)-translocating NADH-quinone reductase subunit C n=1 Tax=Aliikangiella coralliicola TaxID=2592383 RepID=A0A545UHQ7_9GAMM|nr:Na(+)-translocating NADH-quinone reductase subunit C [Aliikangiella coralliicola]TQV88988.1 Na(+)-translocating NADH-quinone reductase subunit C [Aliikangiella coralliicola]
MSANNDTFFKTIIVAVALCLVCSILVSGTAISLKEQQKANASLDKKKNILVAANMYQKDIDISEAFKNFERRFVDLETGKFVEVTNPESFDQRQMAKDPDNSIAIEKDEAKINRRSKVASIYLVKDADKVKTIILPIHGSGLFSTLYGFVALEADKQTVVGLKFYEHGETPGLGGEVDNLKWLASWPGKKLLDANGKLALSLVKGGASKDTEIDALSGATMTTDGINNMLSYWLGEDGFGPFLARLDVDKGEA